VHGHTAADGALPHTIFIFTPLLSSLQPLAPSQWKSVKNAHPASANPQPCRNLAALHPSLPACPHHPFVLVVFPLPTAFFVSLFLARADYTCRKGIRHPRNADWLPSGRSSRCRLQIMTLFIVSGRFPASRRGQALPAISRPERGCPVVRQPDPARHRRRGRVRCGITAGSVGSTTLPAGGER
jgi:hypothetical protein